MNTFFLLASLLFGNPILSDIFSKCFNDSQIRKINDTKDKRSGGLFLLVSDPELEALSFQRLRCSEFGGLGLTADPTVWKSSENQHKLKNTGFDSISPKLVGQIPSGPLLYGKHWKTSYSATVSNWTRAFETLYII